MILERATCGLEAKKVQYSSARFHAGISRIDSPSFDIDGVHWIPFSFKSEFAHKDLDGSLNLGAQLKEAARTGS